MPPIALYFSVVTTAYFLSSALTLLSAPVVLHPQLRARPDNRALSEGSESGVVLAPILIPVRQASDRLIAHPSSLTPVAQALPEVLEVGVAGIFRDLVTACFRGSELC